MAITLCHASADARPYSAKAPFNQTSDLKTAVDAALAAKAKGLRVLVVFDIDNTLLTLPQDLGSDAWFAQTAEHDIHQSVEPEATMATLLRESNLLLNAARMEKTQTNADALVKALQAKGITVMAMSARDPALRGSTERELKANRIDFSPAPDCGPPLCLRRGNITPADITSALRTLKIKAPQKPLQYVTMSDGVILLQGQDKGTFLHLLIHSLGKRRFDDIYFIDDTPRNIESVARAAPYLHGRVHIYQYEKMWEKSNAYKTSVTRQAEAAEHLKAVRETLCTGMSAQVCEAPSAGTTQ